MIKELFVLLLPVVAIPFVFATALSILALASYSRTGPKIKKAIEENFRSFAILSFLRLSFWALFILFLLSLSGPIVLTAISIALETNLFKFNYASLSVFISIAVLSFYFFSYKLLYIPASLQASSQFRFSRLFPLWRLLSPRLLVTFKYMLLTIIAVSIIVILKHLFLTNNLILLCSSFLIIALFLFISYWLYYDNEPRPIKAGRHGQPNIVMLGVDTLRVDRLGAFGYHRDLTPNIDKLCKNGVLLENCITPLARTAPSLASLFSSLWPHHHFIRDNYPHIDQWELPQPTLIDILNSKNYSTSTISDWAGADLGKLKLGFQELSLPEDQWNLKLLIKQGPAYLRLFLSLFTHNKLGKLFLPELYYLAGTPLTSRLGRECRQTISRLVKNQQPFLINLFTSSTHVPFASEYPYYNLFTPPDYNGESRFIKSGLITPEKIVDSQISNSNNHNINQIFNLYDSCVKEFDDEVGKIIDYIEKCGLMDNTYIVLYSDHGTDFFETECWGQGNTLVGKDPSGRIPLIITGPNVPKNARFTHTCRSIDFMPTMLDLLGMEIPKNIDGISLRPYLQEKVNPNLYAYQETGVWMGKIPGLHPDQITYPDIIELLTIEDIESGTLVIDEKYYSTVIEAKNRSIQDDRWKLIYIPTYHGAVYKLYDLKTDPYRDVIDLYPETFMDMKVKLDSWISGQGA